MWPPSMPRFCPAPGRSHSLGRITDPSPVAHQPQSRMSAITKSERGQSMAITDPNERARRAVIRSIADVTELVTIVIDEPDNPDPLAFQVEPDDLFDLKFSRVGIDNDALIRGFTAAVKMRL